MFNKCFYTRHLISENYFSNLAKINSCSLNPLFLHSYNLRSTLCYLSASLKQSIDSISKNIISPLI